MSDNNETLDNEITDKTVIETVEAVTKEENEEKTAVVVGETTEIVKDTVEENKAEMSESAEVVEETVTTAVEENQGNRATIEQALDNATEAAAQKKSKTKIIIASIASLILVAAIVVGIIFFLPENRVSRALDTGYKYLLEEQWEEAIVSFDKAIAIDGNCISAYAGELQAYVAIGDQSRLEDFYEAALDMLDAVDDSLRDENMDDVIDLYLGARKVYKNDPKKLAEVLEKGLEETEDEEIKAELIHTYVGIADDVVAVGEYDKALEIIDRLLEIDEKSEKVQECGVNCLNKYMEFLFAQHRFDEIRALVNKYKDKIPGAAYGDFLSRIAEVEANEAKMNALMQKVFDAMAAEDYDTMCEIDGSDEAYEVCDLMDGNNYVYIPGGNTSGTGSVFCKFDNGYYFYYGDIANGVKSGNGVAFISTDDTGYKVMTGSWSGDAPNGPNTLSAVGDRFTDSRNSFNSTASGNMVNGLWDGFIDRKIYSYGETFNVSFEASMGIPTVDKTKEFNQKYGYNVQYYIYAYDGSYYDGFVWSYRNDVNETLGWFGFADGD